MMTRRRSILVLPPVSAPAFVFCTAVVALASVACSAQGGLTDSDGTWVGTITTEGNVTTVVNESGSVWGGTARLVEEASIGVDAGTDEYMFGSVAGVWASEDEIFVVDTQVPAVRVYGFDGAFRRTIGGAGQGPGEYTDPSAIIGTPAGRIYLLDDHNNRAHVYTRDGGYIETWPARGVPYWPIAVDDDGTLWLPTTVQEGPDPDDFRRAIQAHGPEGPFGPRFMLADIGFRPLVLSINGRDREVVPFAPRHHWAPAGPATFVVGAGDRYRFEYQREGETVRIVERYWDPVPIDPDYVEWARRVTVSQYGGATGSWSWNGAEIPDHMPAFSGLFPMASGEVWVRRRAPSNRQDDCVDDPIAAGAAAARADPCWVVRWTRDVFDSEGRYLGDVQFPPGLQLSFFSFFARSDLVVAAVEDDAGTIMVKRYRLVLPGEE